MPAAPSESNGQVSEPNTASNEFSSNQQTEEDEIKVENIPF